MVPKRLQKNTRLNRALVQGQGTVWGQAGALILPTTTLPIDSGSFERLFQFIAKGLIWHHWRTYLTAEHFVEVWTLTRIGDQLFDDRLFSLNARVRVKENLGNGTFLYEGAQAGDCAQVTAWHIWVYGGVRLSGDAGGRAPVASSRISVVTGPQSAKRYAELASRFGWAQGGQRLIR